MSQADDCKKKFPLAQGEEDAGGESGAGGEGSKIAFREFIAGGPLRDDLLSGEEQRRLLLVHETAHEAVVSKQKDALDKLDQLKNDKVSLSTYRQELGASSSSSSAEYPPHPVLHEKAYFSGKDNESPLPTNNTAETNLEKGEELRHEYNLVHRPQHVPRFNPKPIQR